MSSIILYCVILENRRWQADLRVKMLLSSNEFVKYSN